MDATVPDIGRRWLNRNVTSAPFDGWAPGQAQYRRITLGLFLAGLATFALVYCPQPVLPLLASDFGVGAGSATLALSVTTVAMGVALLVFGPLSDAVGRMNLMRVTLLVAALLGTAVAFMPSWPLLLVLRAAVGVAVAGLPAVAAAYLRDEITPRSASAATGLYIGGTAIGGMTGRLLTGVIADVLGWQWAIGLIGAMSLAIAVSLGFLLPPARRFQPTPLNHTELAANARRMLLDGGLLRLYCIGFTAMGAFVAAFNALAFRLVGEPFTLSVGLASLVFVSYLLGSVSSPYAGRVAARFGPSRVVPVALLVFLLGIAVTLLDSLAAVIVGVALITTGFFAAHGTASAWVTLRAARKGRGTGMAGSLYLAFYYFGSSACGSAAGFIWTHYGWPGVAAFAGALVAVATALAVSLRSVDPVRAAEVESPRRQP